MGVWAPGDGEPGLRLVQDRAVVEPCVAGVLERLMYGWKWTARCGGEDVVRIVVDQKMNMLTV